MDKASSVDAAAEAVAAKKAAKRNYYPPLPRIELCACFFIWVGAYVLSIYPLFGISKQREKIYYNNDYLDIGWKRLTGRYKDTNDFEWSFWKKHLKEVILIGFSGHFIVARIADVLCPKYRFKVFAIYSAIFTVIFLGPHGLAFILTHFAVQYFAAVLTKSVIVCWVTGVTLVYTLTNPAVADFLKQFYTDENRAYFVLFSTAMCSLRYISFSIEFVWALKKSTKLKDEPVEEPPKKITKDENKSDLRRRRPLGGGVEVSQQDSGEDDMKRDTPMKSEVPECLPTSFLDMLIYQMYFPLFYGGPVITYNEFAKQINRPPLVWTRKSTGKFVFGMLRYTFWHVFIDIILHFVYFSVLPMDHPIMRKMPLLALCGLSFCEVYFFYLKYVIMYGMPSHFSSSDNLDIPGGPQCVGSKHRMTDMWKYFDKGLHQWLVRYIFIPLGGSNVSLPRMTLNSILPFVFVCYWHGGTRAQMHWAFLSWVGVYAEALAFKFYRLNKVQEFEARYLTPAWSRRIRGAFSSLTFGLLMTSNLYFLSGVYIGNLYWKRMYYENAFATFLMHVALYGGVQCSMEFQRMGIE